MADHTAPDYYEQVAKESKEEMNRQDVQIEKEVTDLVESHLHSLMREIGKEFGMASVRSANFVYIEDVLYSLANLSAQKAKGVMIDAHYKETRASLDATLDAVLTGIRIGEGAA